MKRCPQCNRVETDEALKFCRVDGATLVSESPSGGADSETVKLGSAESSEIETSLFPDRTDANINRATAATTVLPTPAGQSTTRELMKPNRRKAIILASLMALAVVAAAIAIGTYVSYSRKKNASIQSIAVMPFINAANNPDIEYLSDGMTETLINNLSRLPGLSVKARSSVFRYKGKEVDPQTVGNDLNVQAIVNGRVVQRGDDLTLYLSLVDTRSGDQLWGEQYNRKQADLLSLQNTVARDVATKLRNTLSGADEQKVAKNYTQNTEAYQLYLQGRFFANKRTPQSIQKAIGYYEQAIAKDPNYALGYAGLSDGYGLQAYYGGAPGPVALSKGRDAALHALSLDNNLAEAHNALGFVLAMADFDYEGAQTEYRRALELSPNYTQAHQNLGVMLIRTGQPAEGMAELHRALELEPFSTIVNRLYGECLIFLRRYDEGLAQLKKTAEMDPSFPTTYFALANAYRVMGKYPESVEAYAKYQEMYDRPRTAALARASFAAGGWQGFAREMTAKRPEGLSPWMAAILFEQLGEKDKAFAELDKAFEDREYMLRFLNIDPSVDALRDDPRFKALARRMRLG